jgi:hypothetical protein
MISTHSLILAVKLTNYPEKGYFPKKTPFTVTVTSLPVLLIPNISSNYAYTIKSVMMPLIFEVNKKNVVGSISVNS